MKLPLPTNDTRFPELTSRVLSGNCIAFIGAGFSMPDFPHWNTLVTNICSGCGIDDSMLLPGTVDRRLELMEIAKTRTQDAYMECLHREFASRNSLPIRYSVLAGLPFQSFVTTNFDSCLLQASIVAHRGVYSVYPSLNVANLGRKELFFIHGRIDPDDRPTALNLVFTAKEFEAAYGGPLLRSFLQQVFIHNDVCFLGCSLSDIHLQNVFNECLQAKLALGAAANPSATKWFALADQNDAGAKGLAKFGIDVVLYDKIDSKHSGLNEILSHWAKLPDPVMRTPFGNNGPTLKKGRRVRP